MGLNWSNPMLRPKAEAKNSMISRSAQLDGMAFAFLTLTTVLLCGLQVPLTLAIGRHSVALKTLTSIQAECRAFLQVPAAGPEGECEPRCELYAARAWDDVKGPVYSVYRITRDNQLPVDSCVLDQTYRCMWNWDRFNLTGPEPCRWALSTTFCFFDNFGILDFNKLIYLRPMALELRSVVGICKNIVQVSDQDLEEIVIRGVVDSELVGKLVRCVIIRAGLYSDADGFNLDRLEQMYGAGTIEPNNFYRTAQKCVEKANHRYTNVSKLCLAAYILDDCFEDLLQNIRAAIVEILQLGIE
ncbi:general odorant-binding protein 45-like [Uranotaenia lowii]|uniref:general odorant-binding protein 45-like n=1 Tax=Uranotaenia lowii TaxID=190385 RepID=UPI002478F134|nr:general odorant-binding protein 45-like [Uranotaenia lowii]